MFFSGISYFWGSGVCQKYAEWVLVGCGIKYSLDVEFNSTSKFHIQQVPTMHMFDRPRYPKNKKYLKKCDDDIIIIFFLSISCFWGSGVRQKYTVWVLGGRGIKFYIQRVPTLHTFDRPRYPKTRNT